MPDPIPYLITFAVPQEAGPFRRQLRHADPPPILLTGIGQEAARRSFTDCLAIHRPRLVVTSGFAGGLNPAYPSGTVLFHCPDTLSDLRRRLGDAGAQPAKFVSSNHVLTAASDKAHLHKRTRGDAVEMESHVIHEICREHQLPCATIRVISDSATESLPVNFNLFITPSGHLQLFHLSKHILLHPECIPGLIQLNRRTRTAAEHLATVLIQTLVSPST